MITLTPEAARQIERRLEAIATIPDHSSDLSAEEMLMGDIEYARDRARAALALLRSAIAASAWFEAAAEREQGTG